MGGSNQNVKPLVDELDRHDLDGPYEGTLDDAATGAVRDPQLVVCCCVLCVVCCVLCVVVGVGVDVVVVVVVVVVDIVVVVVVVSHASIKEQSL